MKTAIAIKSCHKYTDRRASQRHTWLKDVDTDFFYVIGRPMPNPDALECEPDTLYCDVTDTFEDIAPKIVCACIHALEEHVTNLLVADDDTYVSWPRMRRSGFADFDYYGFVRNYGATPYMQGSCYWLSKNAMRAIVNNTHLLKPGAPDDCAVGELLYNYGGFHFVHEHRFAVGDPYPEPPRWPDTNNNVIACHKMNDTKMRAAYARHTLVV